MTIRYQNGNTKVTIHPDGTKVRVYEDVPQIVHPESIDVKITDYCDLGCAYCHESSTIKGVHGDLDLLLEVLKDLPAGVELAIGGGNPMSHPGLFNFLKECKVRGFICNLTINQGHVKRYKEDIESLIGDDLIKGLGISITNNNFKEIESLKYPHTVYHVIAGVNDVSILDRLIGLTYCKVLVLGYKQFGLGVGYYNDKVAAGLIGWYQQLPRYVGKCVLSFDNLAIEQLNIRRLFTKEGWEKFYMGDDFQFTMYIDAVKKEFAPTSRSYKRQSFNDVALLEFFAD